MHNSGIVGLMKYNVSFPAPLHVLITSGLYMLIRENKGQLGFGYVL